MTHWKAERICDVVPVALDWLWPRYLARGKLSIIDGDPEMGKSLVTIDLIARLSRGGPLPDGSPLAQPCTSLLLSAEDDAADTIRPRAEAAGTDLSRLVVPNFDGRVPQFPHDIPALEELVRDSQAALVVIDPLMAFLPPSVAANLDQCMRQVLTPLAGLAARTDCAVLFIRHLTKKSHHRAIHRGQGSMGIMAAVRTALFIAADSGDPGSRVMSVAKSNMGRRPPALGFRVIESATGQPVIEWTGPVNRTADELGRREPDAMRMKDRAIDWLKRELANGPRKAAELFETAAAAGIPERTLERAKSGLRAQSHRTWDDKTSRGEWYWYDPDAAWPKKAPFKKPRELAPLPPLE